MMTQNTPKYDRPNTVSGLVAKHAELNALREKYTVEIKKLTVGMGHLEAAIRLFDSQGGSYDVKEYVPKPRAVKGSVKHFVLTAFRTASAPITSRQITEQWAVNRGLASDEATLNELRKQIGACIKSCVEQGLIEDTGWTADHDQNGPYKLWQLKGGGN